MKNKVDFSDYLFRCSSLGVLMTGVKPKLSERQKETLAGLIDKKDAGKITDKQIVTLGQLIEKRDAKPTLSQTVKTHLEKIHKEEVFGKRKGIKSKYLEKGILNEEKGLTDVSMQFLGFPLIKNKERRTNAFITGEPDNTQGKKIRDIKSSWDLSTFPMHEETIPSSDYYFQMQGYLELWDYEEAEVIYVLTNTPDHLVQHELYNTALKSGLPDGCPQDVTEEIENNHCFDDIPTQLRVKTFPVKRDRLAMRQLEEQLIRCREYLNQLSDKLGGYIQEAA